MKQELYNVIRRAQLCIWYAASVQFIIIWRSKWNMKQELYNVITRAQFCICDAAAGADYIIYHYLTYQEEEWSKKLDLYGVIDPTPDNLFARMSLSATCVQVIFSQTANCERACIMTPRQLGTIFLGEHFFFSLFVLTVKLP
jgi:hypothetical protein